MDAWNEVTATELKAMLAGDSPPVLVDVRLEEDRKCCHLPDALGNCVYEVAFEDRMAELAPDKTRPIAVYGADADSLESRMAAEKLQRMGYHQVTDFRRGIAEWKARGFPTVGPDVMESPASMADGDYLIDLAESRIRWIGRNLLNRHEGFIGLKAGWLRFAGGQLTGGGFVIDMREIQCLDLAGDALHDVLIHHLLSHDFFDSEKFPEATFSITGASPAEQSTPGSPCLQVAGTLTLKGNSLPLSFPACTGITPEGKAAAQATLAFDRTLWNVLYGSGRWFRNPGGHLVNDLIELQLRILTD